VGVAHKSSAKPIASTGIAGLAKDTKTLTVAEKGNLRSKYRQNMSIAYFNCGQPPSGIIIVTVHFQLQILATAVMRPSVGFASLYPPYG
jgi:hypothetical protein